MLFTSYSFIAFIVVCFVLYYVLPRKWQWMFLLVVSFIFYASAGIFYPVFLLIASSATYIAAICIERSRNREKAYIAEHKDLFSSREEKKAYRKRGNARRRAMMLAALLGLLAVLGVFKYADFFVDNIDNILYAAGSDKEIPLPDLLLPMGISFYTFQSLGYLIDVYWERVDAQKNFLKHLLFVSFFPQLVQGPISRYSDLSQTLYEEHPFDRRQVAFGLERILWGYFKKLVIADTIITATKAIIGDPDYYTGAWVLVGIIFYGIELYADFTGGIDITIGIAQVFGVHVEENFIRPYFSKNIAEYWRRWHISMGTWFRDYIFYPMSISKSMGRITKWSRKHWGKGAAKRVPVYIATMVTWLATGIWHGAAWHFVVWGLMNGVVILVSQEFDPLYEKFHNRFPGIESRGGWKAFQIIRTFFLMGSLRMFDCYQDVPLTFRMFFEMFSHFNIKALTISEFTDLGLSVQSYIIVAAGTVLMFIASLMGRKTSVRERLASEPYAVRALGVSALFVAIILFGSYGVGYDAAQFIYNQF